MPRILCPQCEKRIGNRNSSGRIHLKTKLVKTTDDGRTGIVCPECRELVVPVMDSKRFQFEIDANSTVKRRTSS